MSSELIHYQLEAHPFNWEIAPGKTIPAWGYNGQVPGPVLRAKKGDTLVVHFTNHLPEPTTIHWHGLRIPAAMDGTEEVQKPVMPGESFEYRLTLPDAGTFWYHPHTNETVQMERGLYGVVIVESTEEPRFDKDRIMVFDDMKLSKDLEFSQPGWFLPRWLERHNGREGNTLLINGEENPIYRPAAGQMERWRLINVSSARYLHLRFGGNSFKIIGTDGGLIEQPVQSTELLLTPGERVDIAMGPFEEGTNFKIESLPYHRGTGKSKLVQFGKVEVGAAEKSIAELPKKLRKIEKLADNQAIANKKVVLHGKRSWTNGVDFTINGAMHLHDEPVNVGALQIWEISNPSMMDHPFHLHGFFFQVLEENGSKPLFNSWKDTVNVPKGGSVKIAWLPDNRPGKWMYHCHILEHTQAGMMAHFEVVDPAMSSQLQPKAMHHQH